MFHHFQQLFFPNAEAINEDLFSTIPQQQQHLIQIKKVITDEFIILLDANYSLPKSSREFWIDVQQGSETQGTFSEDDAISIAISIYRCSRLLIYTKALLLFKYIRVGAPSQENKTIILL